jgi:hypothetical protein
MASLGNESNRPRPQELRLQRPSDQQEACAHEPLQQFGERRSLAIQAKIHASPQPSTAAAV